LSAISPNPYNPPRNAKRQWGEIALRRINRREYESTIKDLLGIRILALKLPDDASGRFDTIGQDQTLSSLDLENYFEQGQEVVRTAIHWAMLPREKAKVVRKDPTKVSRGTRKFYGILDKVQEVHDTDRTWAEVGLTEDEWNSYNRGSKKYPRHAKYQERKSVLGWYFDNVKYHSWGSCYRSGTGSAKASRSGLSATPGPTIGRGPPQEWSMESRFVDQSG
jgi:hypothetical protein